MILQFMFKGDFMQLVLLLLLLMSGGTAFNEVKPLISLAGGDFADMLEEAEELTQLVTALSGAKSAPAPASGSDSPPEFQSQSFPLAPISRVADEPITRSLARYISTGA